MDLLPAVEGQARHMASITLVIEGSGPLNGQSFRVWQGPAQATLKAWLLPALIVAMTTPAEAQVMSGLRSGLRSGYDHYQPHAEKIHPPQYYHASCWRVVVIRQEILRVWQCQPYPPR